MSTPGTNTMTTTTVLTVQGDTVDLICWRLYGEKMRSTRIVEQVLELNHGLADLGAVLPIGMLLIVPVLTTAITKKETVQLWT